MTPSLLTDNTEQTAGSTWPSLCPNEDEVIGHSAEIICYGISVLTDLHKISIQA